MLQIFKFFGHEKRFKSLPANWGMGLGQIVLNTIENNTTGNASTDAGGGGVLQYLLPVAFGLALAGFLAISYRTWRANRKAEKEKASEPSSKPFYLFKDRSVDDVTLEDDYNTIEIDDYDRNFGRQPRMPQ